MDCGLCKKPIQNYRPELSRLELGEGLTADVCPDCVDRFMKWQQGIFAKLFPTKAAKKRYGKV
jgi:hypothetical protein